MKLLLDTHALLWAISFEQELSEQARNEINNLQNLVFVSSISLWELRIKETLKKISLPENFYSSLAPAGYEILQLSLKHIETFGYLPLHHRDPFDRMLVAQAQTDQLTLVTRDSKLVEYDVEILKA